VSTIRRAALQAFWLVLSAWLFLIFVTGVAWIVGMLGST